jgi:hypothetical protein
MTTGVVVPPVVVVGVVPPVVVPALVLSVAAAGWTYRARNGLRPRATFVVTGSFAGAAGDAVGTAAARGARATGPKSSTSSSPPPRNRKAPAPTTTAASAPPRTRALRLPLSCSAASGAAGASSAAALNGLNSLIVVPYLAGATTGAAAGRLAAM